MNCHMNCHDSCHDLRRDAWDSWPPTTALHLAAWCPSCLDQKNFEKLWKHRHNHNHNHSHNHNHNLVGGLNPTPLKNMSQLGWFFPMYGKIKNVPNHQPVIYIYHNLGLEESGATANISENLIAPTCKKNAPIYMPIENSHKTSTTFPQLRLTT